MSIIGGARESLMDGATSRENETSATKTAQSSSGNFVSANVGPLIACVFASLFCIVFIICLVRHLLWEHYRVRCCEGASARRRRLRAEADEAMAQQLQEQLAEEEIKAKRESRREEARVKLQNVTMTVKKEDLAYDRDPEEGMQEQQFQDDDEPTLGLRSAAQPDNTSVRRVPAHCVVCLAVYEPGDTVIWSLNHSCQHCFHDDCILTWLSRGKTRCPCCRKKFVESTKVAEGPTKEAAGEGREGMEEPAAVALAPAPGSPLRRSPPSAGTPSPEERRAAARALSSFNDEDNVDDDPPSDAKDDEADGVVEDLELGGRAAA